MKRLTATILTDLCIQWRNGFYYAMIFVIILWLAVLNQVRGLDWRLMFPALVLSNLVMTTFYFIGGLVLLEKGEGTLEIQVVTPLQTWEYLASKVITLGLMGLFENTLIIVLVYGSGFSLPPLVLGICLASAIYALTGFIAVSRFDSINEYLLPSMLYTLVFTLPLLPYLGLVEESWLFYLHPLQAPLLLLKGAFQPIQAWQWVYGILYGIFCIWPLYRLSRQAFVRFVVGKAAA